MFEFQHPEYLWLLTLVLLLGFIFFLSNKYRWKVTLRFVSQNLIEKLAPETGSGKRIVKQILLLLSSSFLILALANPQVGTRLEEIKREGIDLFVAIDVSLSMKAEDIRPSRLEKAKRDVSVLLKKLAGDRVGLIVFAGEAFVQFPLTADYSAADLFISAVDVDVVPTPGTMIAAAIEKALSSFSKDLPTQKAIVVVSDGENTEGEIENSIEMAKKMGVKVFTIGMGTLEGGPIPINDSKGNRIDYKRDRAGSIVLTRLDERTLEELAARTGASYKRATSGGNEINDIYKELTTIEKTEFGVKQITGYESQFQYPLALAIFFLIMEFLLSERKGKMLKQIKRMVPFRSVTILIFLFVPLLVSAQTVRSHISEGNEAYEQKRYGDAEAEYKKAQSRDPRSLEARFNLGDAYYKQDRYDEALRAFSEAGMNTKNPHEQAASFHNIGNALLKSGKIEESIEAYKQALRRNPTDDDTRYNLQYARELLKQQQQSKDKNQQQQEKDRDKEEKENQKKDQQQNQDQREEEKQQQKNQQTQQDEQQAREEQAKAAQQKHQIPKEQAEQILQALRNNEKELQKQLRKREGVRVKVEKDW